ncbi:MAG TPA: HAMP domain-containing sensor histidine kinase [Candidatus Nitrosocosmicus sp.]|nr:HAMP domain-containing sensor histidine kinase [Candidatus Nitrosocosmicus sp.]
MIFISGLPNYDTSVGKIENLRYSCYLCGKLIKYLSDLHVERDSPSGRRFHHKNCFIFHSRLKRVYGDSIDEMGLERIKWSIHSSDLLQRSLYEIRKIKFDPSEIIIDETIFKKILLGEMENCRKDLLLFFSSSRIFDLFRENMESLFSSKDWKSLSVHSTRIIIPKKRKRIDLLKKFGSEPDLSSVINYLPESKIHYFFSVMDKHISAFSEVKFDKQKNQPVYFNVLTMRESLVWYNAAIFESLWKQSILEKKVKALSIRLATKSTSNNNFMRIMAHELKSPIQPILGFSEMIQSNTRLSTDEKNDLLKIIARNARKLDLITNNILDYARMENNIFTLKTDDFDVVKVVTELISDYQIQADRKKIKFGFNYPEKPLIINADKIRMTEVLDNLLSNSFKFTIKGEILISITRNQDLLHIEVKDSGIGIQDADLNNLFTKFFTTDKLGTGLGLYISKIIIEKHSGKIGAYKNIDKGSTFFIDLPIRNALDHRNNII